MICEQCPKFLEMKEKVFKIYNSAFECAFEMEAFRDKCRESCDEWEEERKDIK